MLCFRESEKSESSTTVGTSTCSDSSTSVTTGTSSSDSKVDTRVPPVASLENLGKNCFIAQSDCQTATALMQKNREK